MATDRRCPNCPTPGTEPNTIVTRLVNGCWSIFRGVLTLAVVLGVALAAYLYFRIDEEAQRLCQAVLNRECEPFVARVGSARFTPGVGVTLRDVEIVERLPWRPPRGVAQVEELRVEGDFDLPTLLRGSPVVRRVLAKTVRVAATRREDGTWNIADLRFKPSGGGPTPEVEFRDTTIMLVNESGGEPIALHHLSGRVTPNVATGTLNFNCSAKGTLADSIAIEGQAKPDGSEFSASAKIEGAAVTPTLLASLRKLGLLRSPLPAVQGAVSLSAQVAQARGAALDWRGDFTWTSNEYQHPGVERPLTDVLVRGSADAAGLRIEQATARWADASVRLNGRRNGWSLLAPAAARLRITNLRADTIPTEVLPGSVRHVLERFKPIGSADVGFDVAFDGLRFAHCGTIDARNASFEDAAKFPYRLTNGHGQILINGGVRDDGALPKPRVGTALEVHLTANADGAPVSVNANLDPIRRRQPGDDRPRMPPGSVEVHGNGVPISPRLIAAIPDEPGRRFVESLHPSGTIDFQWWIQRENERTEPQVALNLRMQRCRLLYDNFPYPLANVSGWVRQENNQWTFSELRSVDTRGRTLVTGNGSLEARDGDYRFDLTLAGEETPLDKALYEALSPEVREAWTLLRPTGQIDFVANIDRLPGQQRPNVRLNLTPHDRSVSINPPLSETGYRYRLEELDGDFAWTDGRFTMRNVRAKHGATTFSTNGEWTQQAEGGWRLHLLGLSADRMGFDRDFLLASTAGLGAAIEELDPRGAIDVFDSEVDVVQTPGPNGPVQAKWIVAFDCLQANVNAGTPIEDISGVVKIGGSCDGATAVTGVELDLDSLFWNGLQLTSISGPMWADGERCIIGEGVAREIGSAQPRPVVAKAYGGDVTLTGRAKHSGRPEFNLAVNMRDVDVTRLSREWLGRPETLQGKLNGQLQLQQRGESIYGLTGRGQMVVTEADLYELPQFLSLLKTLRNRTPDNTAFNRVETKFDLQGNDILFENLDLLGDAISLYGRGKATLQRDLELTFASIVGRNDLAVPVLRPFVRSASEQLLRIRVDGTVDAPRFSREVLPAFGAVFEQIQAEFGGRVTTGASPAVRR